MTRQGNAINSREMKLRNAMLVLKTIMKNAPVSRSKLTRLVGLTQVSVINITNELLRSGIIKEAGKEDGGSHGRRAMILDICEDAFYTIGFELSTGKLAGGLSNAKGEIIDFTEVRFSAQSEPEKMVEKADAIVKSFLKEHDIERKKILGVGLAAPGPLDVQKGLMVNPPNFPKWENVSIVKMLEKKLKLNVCADKESNLAALAENFYGISAGYKTSFFISLFRLGIGGGLLSESNIFHGFRDGAGEIGHVSVEPAGRRCGCGNFGCLETMIAEDYILEQTKRMYKIGMETAAADDDIESLTLEGIFKRSEKGDFICSAVVKQMAAYIAFAIGNIVNMLSPELIVIGGELPEMSGELVEMISQRVHARKYPAHCSEIIIEKSSLGKEIYVKGASALVLELFLPGLLSEIFECEAITA